MDKPFEFSDFENVDRLIEQEIECNKERLSEMKQDKSEIKDKLK